MSDWPPPDWERRFRAPRVHLPQWAEAAPDRAVLVATSHGVQQVHSWTPSTGRLVRATDRASGTTEATIDPAGEWIWWFDDIAGDEYGRWRRQPFNSPAEAIAETPIPLAPAYDAGLLLGKDGTAVIGRSDERYGTQIHAVRVGPGSAGADPRLLYAHREDAEMAALSHDDSLVAIEHSERGDALHPALRVLEVATGQAVAELDDGPGRGLSAMEFAPIRGDGRLLVIHERTGNNRLLIWDIHAPQEIPVELGLPGDVADASWYPGGRSVLVAVDHQARTVLYRHDLHDGATTRLGDGVGTVSGATPRPDGEVWVSRSSAGTPREVVHLSSGDSLLEIGTGWVPGSVPVEDVWADGPGGRVHALLRRPAGGSGPYPVVVDVHGGPGAHDSDSFSAYAAAWIDHGYAVLSVNYRGSTGYGPAWRDALTGQVGHTELADVAAVHEALCAQGVLDRDRSILAGASWGGFLVLLGLGLQPQRWQLGLARVPVADYEAAYADETESLKAFDRAIFGGSPAQVPQAYRHSSPLTYVDHVQAPVLILAGANDPRCPLRQIENYVTALRGRGGQVELDVYDAGHSSMVDDEQVRQMRLELDFVARYLGS